MEGWYIWRWWKHVRCDTSAQQARHAVSRRDSSCSPLPHREESEPCAPAADSWSRRSQVYDTVWERAARRHGITGTLYWHCAANSYPDYDGNTVYLQPEQPPGPDDARVLELIQGHARAMAGCSALPVPEADDGRSPQPGRSPGQLIQSLGRRIRDKLDRATEAGFRV